MDFEDVAAGPCLLGRALALVGDPWSMLILRDAGMGVSRFEQFRTSLGMAPNILARRLKALTENGLLERCRYSDRPPREEYRMTGAGRDFLPILHALAAWGSRHNGSGEVSRIVDEQTGLPIEPVVIDRVSEAPLGTRPLRLIKPGFLADAR